jgi:hypothetical protein
MRSQRVLLGELVIDKEPPIELYAELPSADTRKKCAALKDRLAYLLDTRFRPSAIENGSLPGMTVEEVAEQLHCACVTVLRMVRRGQLHPIRESDDSEPYFDPAEVAGIKSIPLGLILSRIVPFKLGH